MIPRQSQAVRSRIGASIGALKTALTLRGSHLVIPEATRHGRGAE